MKKKLFLKNILKKIKYFEISLKLLLSHSMLFFSILLISFIFFYFVVNQKGDAESINFAGRQRMLLQKMFNEISLYKHKKFPKENILITIKIFDKSMYVLLNGGTMPLDLKGERFIEINKIKDKSIHNKLEVLFRFWKSYKTYILKFVENINDLDFNFFIEKNIWFLYELDSIVLEMQKDAEKTVDTLYYIVIIGIFFSTIIFLISIAISRSVSKLSKLKEEFLAIASHDIKSPFSVILGASEILLLDNSLDEEKKELIKMINKNANIQLMYVNSLLSLLTANKIKMNLNIKQCKINELINECVNSIKILLNQKNINVQTDFECDEEIFLDYNVITQVINNLITNAIKFSDKDGKIIVSCNIKKGDFIEVHIKDFGTGISEEKQKSLFDKKILSSVIKSSIGTHGEYGTGLGLHICKSMIELHGGEIGVKSEVGKGSDFYFSLPLTKGKWG